MSDFLPVLCIVTRSHKLQNHTSASSNTYSAFPIRDNFFVTFFSSFQPSSVLSIHSGFALRSSILFLINVKIRVVPTSLSTPSFTTISLLEGRNFERWTSRSNFSMWNLEMTDILDTEC
ncbi:hypothetical protein ABKN59_010466 [Abortiporus biennis]